MRATSEETNAQLRSVSADSGVSPLLIGAEELAGLLQISTRSLWRLLSAGKVPQPVRLGRSVRWRLGEVEKWIERGCPTVSGDQQ